MWASQGLVQHVNADPLLVHQLEGVWGRACRHGAFGGLPSWRAGHAMPGMGIVPRGQRLR